MGQHIATGATNRRSFASASATGGGGAARVGGAPISQPGGTTQMNGGCNTSRSFHNFGQTHRISSDPDQLRRHYSYTDVDRGSLAGYSAFPGTFAFGSHAARHPGDGIHATSIKKHLVEPLHLEIDLHDQERKVREKEQMKDLNDQFAGLIDKVRVLEERNQMLATKWELLQSHKLPLAQKDLQLFCESFISSLEKKLDSLRCEKSRLESQHETMKNLIEDTREKYEDEVNRRTQAENDFVLLKKEVDDAFEHQKELETKTELLNEQINFLRNLFIQEFAMLSQQLGDTSVLVNMDNSRGFNMDALIRNVESWYQTMAQRSKEEINLFYKDQMNDLLQKQGHLREDVKHNQREIAELNRQIEMLKCQTEREKKKVSSLKASIADVEEHGSRALKDARARQRELQNQLQSDKNDLTSLLQDYQDVRDALVALDVEIVIYRRELEEEEQRIHAGVPVSLDVMGTPGPVHNTPYM